MDQYKKQIASLEKENESLRKRLEHISSLSKQQKKRKKGVLKFIGHTLAGKRLKSSIYKVLDQYHSQRNITLDAISDLLASVVYRITRIGLFALIFAILPSILLIQQNMLLKQQNKKIQDQNYLAEASRRSSQMFIMGDVLSDINTELNSGKTRLSAPLTARVVSLSRAMKPYRFYNKGILIKEPISPERGQFLIALLKSEISASQLSDAVFQNGDFSYADLNKANLSNMSFKDIDLEHSNLSNADLAGSSLFNASLKYASLRNTDLTDAKLHLTDFSNADLTGANLRFTNLKHTIFKDAILDSVKVDRADWLSYISNTLKLKGAKELYETYTIDSLYSDAIGQKVPTLIRKKSLF